MGRLWTNALCQRPLTCAFRPLRKLAREMANNNILDSKVLGVRSGYTRQLFPLWINCANLRSLNYLDLRSITLAFVLFSKTYSDAWKLIIGSFALNLRRLRFLTLDYGQLAGSVIRAYSSIG